MNTHSQNLAFVREKVIAACPEIMELKPGCCVFYEWRGNLVKHVVVAHKLHGGYIGILEARWKTDDFPSTCSIKKVQLSGFRKSNIIGRTIRLSDVLRAIKKLAEVIGWIEVLKRFAQETDVIGNEGSLYYFLIENWNLSQDDLSLQSEPTVAFLAEVLK